MIWTPNKVTFLRVAAGFLAVSLFGRSAWMNLAAVGLTVAAIALDVLDGHLARTRRMATPVGAQIDILGDRMIENMYFTYFAAVGMVSLWLPILFFARGAATDFLRGLAMKAGHSGWGANAMLQTWWGRTLVASRWSRGIYGSLKCVCFCYLGLELALTRGPVALLGNLTADSLLRLLPQGLAVVRNGNKHYLCGVKADQIFQQIAEIRFFEEAVERVAWHARQNHCVVLMTGTLAPLAYLVAVALGCELEARGVECPMSVRATVLEEVHGAWTGKILGPAIFGDAKREAMKKFAAERGMELAESYAYGNSLADGPMLAAAGRAQVINPGRDMAALANRQNWPIWHWHQEKRVVPGNGNRDGVKIRQVARHA